MRVTRGILAAAAVALAVGCTLVVDTSDLVSQGSAPPDAGTDAGGTDGASTPDAPVDAPAEAAATPRSCRDLLGRVTKDGLQPIDLDGDGPRAPIYVYCEMTTAGGGWTLIARSVLGATGELGWRVARGSIGDDLLPFSFGPDVFELAFVEVLVADRLDGKGLGPSAYTLALSAGTIAQRPNLVTFGHEVRTVRGDCKPLLGAPWMLRSAGFSDKRDLYFFRDTPEDGSFGLTPGGFQLNYDDCDRSGRLHLKQGLLFVR